MYKAVHASGRHNTVPNDGASFVHAQGEAKPNKERTKAGNSDEKTKDS